MSVSTQDSFHAFNIDVIVTDHRWTDSSIAWAPRTDLDADQPAAFERAVAQVESFTNLEISRGGAEAEIQVNLVEDNGEGSFAFLPGDNDVDGDIVLRLGADAEFEAGGYEHFTMMHELGHALGLEHAHPNMDHGGVHDSVDGISWTVMTYREHPTARLFDGYKVGHGSFSQTFMQYDIASLQEMYGVNWDHNAGDTVYSWRPGDGRTWIDGQVARDPLRADILMTIWDAGGTDTYDFSAYADDLSIDLTPGQGVTLPWDQTGTLETWTGVKAEASIYNALLPDGDARAYIENAVGGAGDDTIQGNGAGNLLRGGAGDDTILGGAGDDRLAGQGHDDALQGGDGHDRIWGGWGHDRLQGGDRGDRLWGGWGEDVLEGDAGWDRLWGGPMRDHLSGGAGSDRLGGNLGDDLLDGGVGRDRLWGGVGNDLLVGRPGDRLEGGGGRDVFLVASADLGSVRIDSFDVSQDELWVVAGSDLPDLTAIQGPDGWRVEGGSPVADAVAAFANAGDRSAAESIDSAPGAGVLDDAMDAVDLFSGSDVAMIRVLGDSSGLRAEGADPGALRVGDAGADEMNGGGGADRLDGGHGADILRGFDGDDRIDGSRGADRIGGGAGEDVLRGNQWRDQIWGGGGDDDIHAGSHADKAWGGWGADRVHGGGGDDRLWGGPGHDRMWGGAGDDYLSGDDGNDRLSGDLGNDSLFGRRGEDALLGGDGDDLLQGGGQSDILHGGAGADRLGGGWGADVLNGDGGVDRLWGGHGADVLDGGAGNDLLWGGPGDDILRGSDGADRLSGDLGDDRLDGGAGADALVARFGNDRLAGGDGTDSFRIRLDGLESASVIDFAEGDEILLIGDDIRFSNVATVDADGDGMFDDTRLEIGAVNGESPEDPVRVDIHDQTLSEADFIVSGDALNFA